ncbi:MAG: Ig domain-containing protein, partial [Candidatus Thorarchaeota archaeon]|nr:Ig domain-containing protein [Candidatus Thorarchaeota archaeon]
GNNTAKDTAWVYVVDGTWPGVDHPDDIAMDEGSTGNLLTWSPTDANPMRYAIYRNGTELESGPWAGELVVISLDGLSLGVYNYTVYLLDIDDNWNRDIVFVTVVDGTVPIIDSPDDLEYEEGETGNDIEWSPSDLHPLAYEVFLDGTSLVADDWTGGDITVSTDGLTTGVYNFTLVVTDVGGNTASDSVIITVTAASTTPMTSTTPITPPGGPDIVIIIIVAGAAGVILIILVVACRKKSHGNL